MLHMYKAMFRKLVSQRLKIVLCGVAKQVGGSKPSYTAKPGHKAAALYRCLYRRETV